MEFLLQCLDDLDDFVATLRQVTPNLLPAAATVIVATAIVALCLWLPSIATATLTGSVAGIAGAGGVRILLDRSARTSSPN